MIFESAMVHMPEHLRADILELRRPVREMNRRFLQEVIAEMSLRPAVKQNMQPVIWKAWSVCSAGYWSSIAQKMTPKMLALCWRLPKKFWTCCFWAY